MKVLRFQWNMIKMNRCYVHSGLLPYYIWDEKIAFGNFFIE